MDHERVIRGIIESLESTRGIAEDAHLTGAFKGGINRARALYNGALKYFQTADLVNEFLFSAIDDDASFDDIGVACGQLSAYMRGYVGIGKRKTIGPMNIDINELIEGIKGKDTPSDGDDAPDAAQE